MTDAGKAASETTLKASAVNCAVLPKVFWKNLLTFANKYDNITKLSRGDRADLREEKKPKERSERSS